MIGSKKRVVRERFQYVLAGPLGTKTLAPVTESAWARTRVPVGLVVLGGEPWTYS